MVNKRDLNWLIEEIKEKEEEHTKLLIKLIRDNIPEEKLDKYWLKAIIGNVDVDLLNKAIRDGLNFEVIELLIDGVNDINEKVENRDTPLVVASTYGDIEIVKYLLEKGADIDEKAENRDTPLVAASAYGNIKVVEYLLEKGADINKKGKYDLSPVATAICNKELEIAKLLIRKGADIFERCGLGLIDDGAVYNVLEFLIAVKDMGIDDKKEMIDFLKDEGKLESIINAQDKNGSTPVMLAAQLKNLDFIDYLKNNGANMDMKMVDGTTVFDILKYKGVKGVEDKRTTTGKDEIKGKENSNEIKEVNLTDASNEGIEMDNNENDSRKRKREEYEEVKNNSRKHLKKDKELNIPEEHVNNCQEIENNYKKSLRKCKKGQIEKKCYNTRNSKKMEESSISEEKEKNDYKEYKENGVMVIDLLD